MSEKILVATISSEKSPQKGQKHRSSDNFRLYRPQSGFLHGNAINRMLGSKSALM